MASVAKGIITKDKNYKHIPVEIEVIKENAQAAFGTGTGIM